MNANKICACKLVWKCIDKDICDIFKDHFAIQDHEKETRNANNSLKMPKIRTEYARKSFYCTGAKIYNDLPLKIFFFFFFIHQKELTTNFTYYSTYLITLQHHRNDTKGSERQ